MFSASIDNLLPDPKIVCSANVARVCIQLCLSKIIHCLLWLFACIIKMGPISLRWSHIEALENYIWLFQTPNHPLQNYHRKYIGLSLQKSDFLSSPPHLFVHVAYVWSQIVRLSYYHYNRISHRLYITYRYIVNKSVALYFQTNQMSISIAFDWGPQFGVKTSDIKLYHSILWSTSSSID